MSTRAGPLVVLVFLLQDGVPGLGELTRLVLSAIQRMRNKRIRCEKTSSEQKVLVLKIGASQELSR